MTGDGSDLNQNTIALTSGGKTSRLLHLGEIIGDKYRLKGLIGRGGMGYVFRAEHTIIGKDCALKMLAPDQVNEITWNRFQAEGRAIARLDHANIVKIYDMGVDQGDSPFYVMDLLEGMSLADCIKEKMPFTVDEILHMFMQMARGFGYAHGHGIIHRDIKPGNIVLVDEGGRYPVAKIVDFGIAKLAGKSDLNKQSLTATGEVFGSPFYMSPEQCLGDTIDQRSDIYSLGCTLFEVLCGRPPFVGEGPMQTVLMHQNKPSPTIESVGGKFSSDEMEALVAKMLMKRPSDRYQSMEQVFHDLDRIWQRKGVGKNMETGFRSSVDIQLDGLEEKLGEDEEKAGKRKKVVLISACTVVALIILAATCVTNMATKKETNKPVIIGHPDLEDVKRVIKDQQDESLMDSVHKLEKVKTITSMINKTTGMRTFHFPDFCVGRISWHTGGDSSPGNTPNTRENGLVQARGDVAVPANVPLSLQVTSSKSRETWAYPQFLSKIGPGEFNALVIEAENFIDEDPHQDETVIAFCQAVQGWTNLEAVYFCKVQVPDRALLFLSKHRLKSFEIRGNQLNEKVLAARPFMQTLQFLSVASELKGDPILEGLKGSQSIEQIELDRCTVSAAGLQSLVDCHNLKYLRLIDCTIAPDTVAVLPSIKSLIGIAISGAGLTPDHLPMLAKLAKVPALTLDVADWPAGTYAILKKRLPQVNLILKRGKPGNDIL